MGENGDILGRVEIFLGKWELGGAHRDWEGCGNSGGCRGKRGGAEIWWGCGNLGEWRHQGGDAGIGGNTEIKGVCGNFGGNAEIEGICSPPLCPAPFWVVVAEVLGLSLQRCDTVVASSCHLQERPNQKPNPGWG